MSIRIHAKCIREIYHNDNFYVLAFVPTETNREIQLNQYNNFTCCGELGYITVGKEYELEVTEGKASKYGTSYNIISVPSMVMENLSELTYDQKYEILMECTSSDRIARNILEDCPNYIELAVMEGEDAIDISKIHGVGKVYNKAYCRQLISKYKYYSFCQNADMKKYEINISEAKELFDKYSTQEGIIKNVNSNPYYVLLEVCNRGFELTDKLLCNVRPDLIDSDERTEALIIEILKRNEYDGSSRLNGTDLYYIVKEDYNCDNLIPKLKTVAVNSDLIYFDEKSGDLSIMATYLGECEVCDFIMSKNANPHKLDIDWTKYTHLDGFDMTPTQANALKNFCEYDVSILVGYSGGGKTTSVGGLIQLMEDNHITYTLLSTTGKASKVLSESTHRPASTIHRCCYSGDITTDAVIVDEFSMCSLDVMMLLLHSIANPNIKVVFVYDSAQLPAIGLSKIGTDLLESDVVPKTVLTEVFRYTENGSLFVATNIRQGKNFLDDTNMVKYHENSYSVSNNYKFINANTDDDIFDEIILQYKKLIDKHIKQEDILVLSPQNVGTVGTYAINNALQAEYNPPKPNEKVMTRKINGHTVTFRTNDLVVNKKNDYCMPTYDGYLEMQESGDMLSEEDVEHTMVLNGQIGRVTQVTDKGLVIKFDEELVYFSKAKINNLLLAYAISTHSSQGSTCQYSISVVSSKHKRMLSKALLYVADTRCRKAHIDIGEIDAFEYALTVDENKIRNTWLKQLLIEWKQSKTKEDNKEDIEELPF